VCAAKVGPLKKGEQKGKILDVKEIGGPTARSGTGVQKFTLRNAEEYGRGGGKASYSTLLQTKWGTRYGLQRVRTR